MNVRPLEDRVLIKPLDAEEKTAGGIVLPDSAKKKQQRGKVIAVGEGKLLDSGKRGGVSVKAGDTVVFGKYAGSEIKIGGFEHQIMRESEILAVLDGA
jgi:chaperonin GroES